MAAVAKVAPSAPVRERPILFSGPMIRALLAGTKTQTRRVITKVSESIERVTKDVIGVGPNNIWWMWDRDTASTHATPWRGAVVRCPYGAIGDRLWVRETWYDDSSPPAWPEERERYEDGRVEYIEYRADHDCANWEAGCPCRDDDGRSAWRPSIFMPRWASRLTLEITSVRVERVQMITEEDAQAEGVGEDVSGGHPAGDDVRSAREMFRELWDAINGKRAPWSANPWVWALTFRRIEGGR